MTFFDCTADLVGQLNGNGHKGMLQIDAAPVENFWLRHWPSPFSVTSRQGALLDFDTPLSPTAALPQSPLLSRLHS